MRPRDAIQPAAMTRRTFLSRLPRQAPAFVGIYFGDALAQMSGPGKTVGGAAAGNVRAECVPAHRQGQHRPVVVKHLEMGQGVYTGLPR